MVYSHNCMPHDNETNAANAIYVRKSLIVIVSGTGYQKLNYLSPII